MVFGVSAGGDRFNVSVSFGSDIRYIGFRGFRIRCVCVCKCAFGQPIAAVMQQVGEKWVEEYRDFRYGMQRGYAV